MKVKELLDSGKFQVIHAGEDPEREITTPFCCDLLSVAMGKAPAYSANLLNDEYISKPHHSKNHYNIYLQYYYKQSQIGRAHV